MDHNGFERQTRHFPATIKINQTNPACVTWLCKLFSLSSGGVRTLIALHQGRKTKNKSFATCRGRMNISGSSKIAWINVEFNGNSLSVAVPSKVKKCLRACGLLLFLLDKFVVRRQLKRFRKNRNCSLARESIYLTAATHTADGCVNNIKFASYLTGNRPLTCKRIPKRQLPFNKRTIFHVIHLKAWIRDSRKERLYAS